MHALTESLSRISAELAMRTVPQNILRNNIQARNQILQPLELMSARLE